VATCSTPVVPDELIRQLFELRDQMLLHERRHATEVASVAPGCEASARNLLHYLGLRQHDLRALQGQLAQLGLSSLGRCEPHALASVEAVLAALHRMCGRPVVAPGAPPPVDFASGPDHLRRNAEVLLGASPPRRDVRIMVTMPSEAAEDGGLVRDLVAAGMDVMRINAAHDGPEAWQAMVRNLEQARREQGRPTRIQLDLPGPKLRTGALEESARLVRWRVRRDVRGRTLAPARIWLAPADADAARAPAPADAVLPIDGELLARSRVGDVLRVRDSRDHKRSIRVVATAGSGRWGECDQGAFVETGADLRLVRGSCTLGVAAVGTLPPVVEPLLLRPGDRLRLCAPGRPGRPPGRSSEGDETLPAEIPCTLPEVFDHLRVGERVLFDDGKLASEVRRVDPGGVLVEITRTPPGGGKLRADRGINLPDSDLHLPPLTDEDLESLDFAVAHADLIGQSFVRRPEDVHALHDEMVRRGGERLGVLLKIETRAAFDELPRILLAAMCSPPTGVMVARGDLAVEVGYERLAEVQEEVLWLCEAAQVPVVWATQVLETLAKKGQASRAEVSDAAMSGRAECVMLNKGPYVVEAVRFLDDILHRMKLHQEKKRSMLRRLSISSLTGRFRQALDPTAGTARGAPFTRS
jgi:pyruvate kinase